MNTPWWQRTDLRYRGGRLHLGAHDLAAFARAGGTPAYAYHAPRVSANFRRLRRALAGAVRRPRVFYAMKSNRFVPLLGVLRAAGAGVDVCSPEELLLARQCGFPERDISFTGTSLSEDDARVLARHPGVILNCDSLASLRRIARLAPGRTVGLRINPGLGLGYRSNRLLRYAGGDVTKFGIYAEQFPAALALARDAGLRINGLHFHTGCGYLTPQLPVLDRIFARVRGFIRQAPPLDYVNLGGGLGIPLTARDAPLDLARWSAVVRRHFGRDRFTVCVEPGDYLVKDAGVLLLEVNTVEEKAGRHFVGVNGGFNLHLEPAFYDLPLEPVPVVAAPPAARRVTIAGNINEALDVLARNVRLPRLAEGDVLAFLNAGGYGAAMSSQHCLRGAFREYLLP
ncbi:MAG TPA: diaminopimelate decarboxylase [Opitutaceae bacterium]|nr:diaminopimelate decarboxylase [Opitutaceae bacterium]